MMSVSQVAIKQREEESQKLKVLLICSLTVSLLLHLALLVSGIFDLINQVNKQENANKPIEITFVDIPKPEPKPVEKKLQPKLSQPPKLPQPKIENTQISSQLPVPSPVRVEEKTPVIQPVRNISNFSKPNIRPLQPLISPSTLKTPVSEPPNISQNTSQNTSQNISKPEPVKPPIIEPSPKVIPQITPRSFSTPAPVKPPIIEPSPKFIPQITPRSFSTPAPVSNTNLEKLRNSIAKVPDSSTNNNQRTMRKLIDGDNLTNINNPNSNTTNNSDSDNVNPSTASNNAPTNNSNSRTLRTTFSGGNNNNNNNNKIAANSRISNSGDGRASCVQCGTSYPSWARRRGIEGRVVVAVDTDSAGNVINVELVSSSGSSRLDEEHLNMVRGWKLKPSENGRTGVIIATEYVLN